MYNEGHSLHIEEGVEQGVDELSCHLHEPWQISLQSSVDIIVLVGRNLKVLLKLIKTRLEG